MSTTDGRALCIMCSPLIGDGLRWLLPLADGFNRRFRLVWYGQTAPRLGQRNIVPRDQVEACTVLLYHHPVLLDLEPAERQAYENFLECFPAECRKVLLPYPRFPLFWPFDTADPLRHLPPPRLFWPFDTPSLADHPYGDDYAERLLAQGYSPTAVTAKYLALDIAEQVSLDGLLRHTFSDLTRRDYYSDVKICDFVADSFRAAKLFSTINLPSNRLLLYIANQMLSLLELPHVPGRILDTLQPLTKREMPIHPSFSRYFGNYAGPEVRYRIDRRRHQTFEEYIYEYSTFRAGQCNIGQHTA